MTGKEPVKAVVDVNEPARIFAEVMEHDEVKDALIEPLSAADIVIGGIGIERKSWSDFVQSMKDGRLEEQTEKLGTFDFAYILIDGDDEASGDLSETEDLYWTEMKPESIRGRVASLTAREGSNVRAVIPCSETRLLVDLAVRLARKHNTEPSSPYLPSPDVGEDAETGEVMWGAFSDVGPKLASQLYEEFGTPTAFTARTNPQEVERHLESIEGIGRGTSEQIYSEMWGGRT